MANKVHYTRTKLYFLIVIIFAILIALSFFIFNPPKDRVDNVYENRSFDHQLFKHIHFKEMSDQLGIKYRHLFNFEKNSYNFKIDTLPPSVSVIDINRDGFMDLFITTEIHQKNLLYINHNGKFFTEEAEKYGLADLNRNEEPSLALWGDFNNDGETDLLFARYGKHSLFYGKKINGDFKLIESPEALNGYQSRPNGVNVGDFYQNGKLNFVFANFLPRPGDESYSKLWTAYTRYDNQTGGENHLLKNLGNGKFEVDKNANFITKSYSHNAGISDIDLDGKPDIFFSNDYAHDELFLNKGNGIFTDITDEYIPKVFHGLSGMNTEFFDYNQDGLIDLYVSNGHKPPFNRHVNVLWKKKKDNHFEMVSTQLGNARCGFSWAAKFSDFDLDGEPDLFVANGRNRAPHLTRPEDGKSLWFERYLVSQIPRILKKYYQPIHEENIYASAFERKCFFVQKNGEFFDVAEDVGLDDREENRGMAIFDFDNDGRMDMVTSGPLAKLKVFQNTSEIKKNNQWIGFSFIEKSGNIIPHGLILEAKTSSGKIIKRELYPANGYRGFNDSRIHIGLGENNTIAEIKVFWPQSRREKSYKNFNLNQYNVIKEND